MEKLQLPDYAIQSLENSIYELLMQNTNADSDITEIGDVLNCRESASRLIAEWMDENNIEEKP